MNDRGPPPGALEGNPTPDRTQTTQTFRTNNTGDPSLPVASGFTCLLVSWWASLGHHAVKTSHMIKKLIPSVTSYATAPKLFSQPRDDWTNPIVVHTATFIPATALCT